MLSVCPQIHHTKCLSHDQVFCLTRVWGCRPAFVPTKTRRVRTGSCSAITLAPKTPVVQHSLCSQLHSGSHGCQKGMGAFVKLPYIFLGLGVNRLSFKLISFLAFPRLESLFYLIFFPGLSHPLYSHHLDLYCTCTQWKDTPCAIFSLPLLLGQTLQSHCEAQTGLIIYLLLISLLPPFWLISN